MILKPVTQSVLNLQKEKDPKTLVSFLKSE